jgi:energy-coupling factor transport system ATP-binding protein
MDDVANFADYVYVLQKGSVALQGSPQEVFNQVEKVQKIGIGLPQATNFALKLQEQGFKFAVLPLTIKELAQAISQQLSEVKY